MEREDLGLDFFDTWFSTTCSLMKQDGVVESTSKQFKTLDTDEARVAFALKLDAVKEVFKIPTVSRNKSSIKATEYRNNGNKHFQKKQYTSALELYTQSVAMAPCHLDNGRISSQNKDLAMAFANRSAALFYLRKYADSVVDTRYALQSGYPADLVYKLYDRQGKCFLQLKQLQDAISSFNQAKTAVDGSGLDGKKKQLWLADLEKNLEKCQQQSKMSPPLSPTVKCDAIFPSFTGGHHPVFVNLSSAVEVAYLADRGRHIMASRDIMPGEIILIEKPYASVVLTEPYLSHCHHCFKHCQCSVPCQNCPLALFCGESCREAAWKSYHELECPILDVIHKSGVGKFGHLALRTVAVATWHFLQEYGKKLKAGDYDVEDKVLVGCSKDGKYLPDDYNAIIHLVTHAQDRAAHDLFRRALTAVFLLKCLQTAGFFTDPNGNENEASDENLSFIGGLILSHLQLMPCNAHEISELELDRKLVATSETVEVGAGIYSTLSLFNHSCDPVVTRHFYGDTCVMRTIKTVRKGEEVSDNYGVVFAMQTREERWQKLKPQYFFQCACQACAEDWPLYPSLNSTCPIWLCSKCRTRLTSSSGDSVTCKSCQAVTDVTEVADHLKTSLDIYQAAFTKLLDCDVTQALPPLLSHLHVMDSSLRLPWKDYNSCQEAVKQCYSIMANCHIVTKGSN